MRARVGGCACG